MKVGVLTSGGDSPGMNTAIAELVAQNERNGLETIGIYRGFNGFFQQEYRLLSESQLGHSYKQGGSVLLAGRNERVKTDQGRAEIVSEITNQQFDVLVIIGGNGSIKAASLFAQMGVKVIAIPASIDNDIYESDYSIGFDTCLNVVMDSLDRIRDTAISHDRVHVVEVMGRDCGLIALEAGRAAFAEYILVPGIPVDLEQLCNDLQQRRAAGRFDHLVVVAEGFGSAHTVSKEITAISGVKTTATVLGQIQRGGAPTAYERRMARTFAYAASEAILTNQLNVLICSQAAKIISLPLDRAGNRQKLVEP